MIMPAFRTVRGVDVPSVEGVIEAYSVVQVPGHFVIKANVSAERIGTVFRSLASHVPEPGFFVIEIPAHRDEEERLRKSATDPFHVAVHYRDGLSWSAAEEIFFRFETLFIHDGEVSFGFGAHRGIDEVLVGAYKIFRLHSTTPARFEGVLAGLGFPHTPNLTTVWDHFSGQNPGTRSVLKDARPSIYEMVETLKTEGFYFAEFRAE